MFPKVAAAFFTTRAVGPKNLGKDPGLKPAVSPAPEEELEASSGPVRTPISYEVRLNGKSHKVTVSPV
jgi:methylmalonyl-CoA carboxyltransferase 5S subunit